MNIKGSYSDLEKIYKELDSIPFMNYRYFVDQYEENIFRFGKDFFIDSHYQYRYTKSLFELGEFRKFLSESKSALSFLLNIEEWESIGKENYKNLIFDMAIAHSHLREYKKYRLLKKELIRLDFSSENLNDLSRSIILQKVRRILSCFSNKYLYYGLLTLTSIGISYLITSFLFN